MFFQNWPIKWLQIAALPLKNVCQLTFNIIFSPRLKVTRGRTLTTLQKTDSSSDIIGILILFINIYCLKLTKMLLYFENRMMFYKLIFTYLPHLKQMFMLIFIILLFFRIIKRQSKKTVVSFYTHWKTWENLRFSRIFKGYRKIPAV